ncbi:MAG: hypothetical protein HXY40_19295 [Chloroflexi bacterium]|nr:hypothetical protein [Chloroflexota bacterium]
MAQDQIDYRAVLRRVEEGIKKQKTTTRAFFLASSFTLYTIFMLIGWGIAREAGVLVNEDAVSAMVMLSVAGFMSLLFQFISVMLETKAGEASIRERLIARELGEEMLRLGMEDEAQDKRKRVMRLSSDGELAEIVDESSADDFSAEERGRSAGA